MNKQLHNRGSTNWVTAAFDESFKDRQEQRVLNNLHIRFELCGHEPGVNCTAMLDLLEEDQNSIEFLKAVTVSKPATLLVSRSNRPALKLFTTNQPSKKKKKRESEFATLKTGNQHKSLLGSRDIWLQWVSHGQLLFPFLRGNSEADGIEVR